ncbi:hypothetical protein KAX21_01300 [candidate division WOR-3 bacterium]|nr:hypothetical protein [candidate division WOR-3 bacterium]
MHKSVKIVALVVGAIFFLSATFDVAPDIANISVVALSGGDGVKVSWSSIAPYSSGCWGKTEDWLYALYLDDELVADSLEETEYDLYEYGHIIEVVGFGSAGETDPAVISIAPTPITELTVYELNGDGPSGIGFDPAAKCVASYTMTDSTNRDDIDCYFTNWVDYSGGFGGLYYLVSANQVTSDPGGEGLAATGWRSTSITEALDVSGIEDVEVVPALGYASVADSVEAGETFAILTQDGYYGLIQVINIDTINGQIDIKATFQPIQRLRWM